MAAIRDSIDRFALGAARAYQPLSHAAKERPMHERVMQVLRYVERYDGPNERGPRVREIFEATETKCNQYIRKAKHILLIDTEINGMVKHHLLTERGREILRNPDSLHELL